MLLAALTDWLQAIGGIGAFLTTVILAVIAGRQMTLVREQAVAAREQARATRDATRAQLQPLVYAHRRSEPRLGPIPEDEYGAGGLGDVIEFTYHLRNEGLGPALNIEHGIELHGEIHLFGGGDEGAQFRTCAAGEFLPPLEHGAKHPVPREAIRLELPGTTYSGRRPHNEPPEVYFCRFQSLFGERWETRNFPDPTRPPEIRPVD